MKRNVFEKLPKKP